MLYRKRRSFLCSLTFVVTFMLCASAYAGFPAFEYHRIDRIGKRMGQTSLVDVDKDGDLDWITGCNGGDIWWFEYKGPDNWIRHLLGRKAPTDVGGTAFDIDGDGWVDQVSGQAWYRNTGRPREQEFIKYPNGAINTHDNVAIDIDGDKKLDVGRAAVALDLPPGFTRDLLRVRELLEPLACSYPAGCHRLVSVREVEARFLGRHEPGPRQAFHERLEPPGRRQVQQMQGRY